MGGSAGAGSSDISGGVRVRSDGGGAGEGGGGGDYGRFARGRMTDAGRRNVASWLAFMRKPLDQGGMGYTGPVAHGQVAMMQGESGINLDPAAMGDRDRRGVPDAFGTGQWSDAKGNDRFPRLKALAAEMGKDWRDRGVQQEMYRREMLGRYRGVYNAITRDGTGEGSLRYGINGYENPQKHALAFKLRKPFLDRLRREADRPTVRADEPRLVKGLDGVEGLDLGNGTMRMPNGSIRSITPSGLTIPDAPAGGFGGAGGRGMSELREHVAELACPHSVVRVRS